MAVINEEESNASQGQSQPGGSTGNSQPTTGPVAVPGGGGIGSSPIAGATNAGGGANANTTPTSISPAQQSQNGQGFTDVAAYLNANQSGGQQLGNAVSSNLNNQYNTLNSNINQSSTNFNNSVNAGYTPENQSLIAQAAADPNAYVNSSPNAVQNFQNQFNDTYTGPTSWTDSTNSNGVVTPGYGTLQGQVSSAQQEANLINTPGGNQVLVSQVENTPTAGISGLDSLLFSGNPGAIQQVQAASAPFSGVTGYLNSLNTTNTGNVSTAQNNAAQPQSNAQNAFIGTGGVIPTFEAALSSQLTADQQNAVANNASLMNDLKTDKPTPADLVALNMTQDQWNALQSQITAADTARTFTSGNGQFGATSATVNIDPSQWLTQVDPTTAITAQNDATQAQYLKSLALQQLVGGAATLPLTAATQSQAGTAPTNFNNYDYNTATKQAQNTIDQENAAAQAYADALQSGADAQHAEAAAANAAKNLQYAQEIGAAIGSKIGAAVGSVYGPVGTVAGGVIGTGVGYIGGGDTYGAIQGFKNDINGSSSTGTKAADIATIGGYSATKAAVNDIVNLFCFNGWMKVEMADGSEKEIKNIKLGDITKGGKVVALRQALVSNLYNYKGVLVSGNHAVKEDKWIRVKDSIHSQPLYIGLVEESLVYNLVTTDHRIWINNIEFADEIEQNNYEEITMDESLEQLNGK